MDHASSEKSKAKLIDDTHPEQIMTNALTKTDERKEITRVQPRPKQTAERRLEEILSFFLAQQSANQGERVEQE